MSRESRTPGGAGVGPLREWVERLFPLSSGPSPRIATSPRRQGVAGENGAGGRATGDAMPKAMHGACVGAFVAFRIPGKFAFGD